MSTVTSLLKNPAFLIPAALGGGLGVLGIVALMEGDGGKKLLGDISEGAKNAKGVFVTSAGCGLCRQSWKPPEASWMQ